MPEAPQPMAEQPRPDPAPVQPDDHDPAHEVEVALLPEPDIPDPGKIDPADDYKEGVDLDG
jgi:hypothetical protein